ncbi:MULTISPECIES: hypothetical protein [Burkholderia]|uniref:hypothetical protein n=1 Tax=Burkholderia TaxID=32008 RepID=UPI0018DE8988|nr:MULTISPECIES: hypothetical protein [Burkholderia]MBI0327673.1 hypothetical protein [Burkholderia plantarii]
MRIILLTGEQGTLKSSVWGPAIKCHFQRQNKNVLYIDYDRETDADFAALLIDNPDVVIVDTDLGRLPFAGYTPDFVIHVTQREAM